MKKLFFAFAAILALSSCVRDSASYEVSTQNCEIRLTCYTPSIIRVEKYPLGSECPETSLSPIVLQPEKVNAEFEKFPGYALLSTSSLELKINLEDGSITYCDAQGRQILEESSFYMGETPAVSQTYTLADDEAIYGLGQHQKGYMNLRGTSETLRQANMEIAIPLVHSVKGYALYWDNGGISHFSDDAAGMTMSFETGAKLDCYFIYGGSADGVIAQIRKLSGKAPMNPLWTFGYNQSRERYGSAAELCDVVKKYRDLGVPLDGIIQDWRYWGENDWWNAVEFRAPGYEDPQKMMDDIHAMNAHCLISVWPSFGRNTDIFKELSRNNLLLPFDTFPDNEGVRNFNAYDSEACDIYWSYMSRNIFSKGIDGWWLDATEPEYKNPSEDDMNTQTPYGPFREVLNYYPLCCNGGVYERQRAQTSDKRVMILTRSAAFGQQRYGAHSWSGDVVSSWETLSRQIPAALNFSMCGIPYWNSDIGGFFPHNYPGGYENDDFRLLYTRWLQFATFTALMRSHGTGTPREIYRFGKKGEKYYDAIEKFINLRYRLIPYIYSAAYDVTFNDAPLMRPLFMDWPDNADVYDVSDEYMFGKSLLVAPLTSPDPERNVFLPEGKWYDFWDGSEVGGNMWLTSFSPLDQMPLYVRAGAILPMGPKVMYSSEKPWDSLQIRIYRGADGEFTLYEDEGDNYNYENGAYSTIRFTWNEEDSTLTIGPRKGNYTGMLQEREFRIAVVSPDSAFGMDCDSFDAIAKYSGEKIEIKL